MNAMTENAIAEITEAICEIAEGNDFIDFEEFLDILQEIEIDTEEHNESNCNKTNLKKFFCDLLVILRCDLDELNIAKFNNYVLSNYNSFINYAKLQQKKTQKQMKLSAVNYMKYLIDLHLNPNKTKTKNKSKIKNKTKNKGKHKKNGPIPTEILLLIGSEMTEYLEGSESMDYQDFIGCCREFLGDKYPEQNLKIVYEFIAKQQLAQDTDCNDIDIDIDTEITVSFFIRFIAKYGDKYDDINDVIKCVFDKISFNQLQSRQSEIIKNLRSYLENKDAKRCGMITLEEFISGLKSANVTSISSRDMKKIFNLSTTNGRMKINLFMDRFINTNTLTFAYDIDQLILIAFDGIIKKKTRKKKKKKKKKLQQQQITINDDMLDSDMLDINLDILDINDEKDGFEKLQIAFKTMDENHDNKIDFKEFMAVIIGDLKMNLKENECKQIYYHQALQRDFCLDLNEFFDQIHEEFLSFSDATSIELLHRYFAKILHEAAPFEKLNEFILDHIMPPTPAQNHNISNLQCEIMALYGSMSTNPLLRRIHKQQTFDYTNKYLHFLQKNVTPRILGVVIRSIRKDSPLKDAEISKMYNEWLICLNRTDTHKFNDLFELDFLLFHLGLIVSRKLVKRFSNTFLNTVFESDPVSPRNSKLPNELQPDPENSIDLIPSFMKSTRETLNLQLLKFDLNKIKKSNINHNEDDSYHSTKKQYANQIIASQSSNVKFKLIDLIGEFIDDKDNTISIREQLPHHTPPNASPSSSSMSAHENIKIFHRRARSELLLSKIGNKTILQRRKERIAKQKKQKEKAKQQMLVLRSVSMSFIDRDSIEKEEKKCEDNMEGNKYNQSDSDNEIDRQRSRSFNSIDIDLVSNHQLSENRFWARTLSLNDAYGDGGDDEEEEEEEELLTESVTLGTSITDDEDFEFDGDIFSLLEDEEVDDEELKLDEEKYHIIGQEKVSFDPLTSTAIYDPMRNILVWSNGTKWIKKDFKIFCGKWRDQRGYIIMIDENGLIHYIAPKLGTFQCRIVGFYKIAIQFQSNIYNAQLIDTNNLKWENGTIWKRVGDQIMYFVM